MELRAWKRATDGSIVGRDPPPSYLNNEIIRLTWLLNKDNVKQVLAYIQLDV